MTRVEPDQFLTALTKLYESTKAKGHSVHVSCKKFTPKGANEPCLLMRCCGPDARPSGKAKSGKKRNFSTLVEARNAESFHAQYANILFVHLYGLEKKKDKSKRSKAGRKKNRRASE
jgi:hypothetical protein